MKRKIIGFYNYTVILTYCGLISAILGITRVFAADFVSATVCLMFAGICDMFDGTIAQTRKRTFEEKRFGIQIDSLCDLVCFGAFPAFFVYNIAGRGIIVLAISCLYILCALIRLAYFNVTEEERQDRTDEKRKNYLGVPVTSIALVIPALMIIYNLTVIDSPVIFPVLLFITAIAFVAPVRIPKPHKLGKAIILVIGIAEVLGMSVQLGILR